MKKLLFVLLTIACFHAHAQSIRLWRTPAAQEWRDSLEAWGNERWAAIGGGGGPETDPVFSAWLSAVPNISIFTNDAGYLTAESDPTFSTWLAGPPNVSVFTNDAGYLTSFSESDPVFIASDAFGISATDISHWNTAYGWGNHAGLYLSSSTSSTQDGYFGKLFLKDQISPSHYLTILDEENLTAGHTLSLVMGNADRVLTISGNADISGTNTGDQDLSGYLTSESDPLWAAWHSLPPNLSEFTNDVGYLTAIPNLNSVLAQGDATSGQNLVITSGDRLYHNGVTASTIAIYGGSKELTYADVATYPSLAELAYLKGTSSAIQTQFSNKQPLDADLTSIAALGSAADKTIYTTAANTWAETDLSTFGRSLIDDAAASNARTTLGASTVGANIFTVTDPSAVRYIKINADNSISLQTAAVFLSQIGGIANDAELAALAGLTSLADKLPYFTGSGTASTTPLTSFARTLIDDADQATMQSTLGIGSAGLLSSSAVFQVANNLSEGTAATMRTNLGATTVGGNIFTLTNPGALGYIRVNADNTVTHRTYANVKTDLSLDNVENTALSTWAGSSNITTLGTITSGGLGSGAVIGPVTMTLAANGTGDMYYRNSSGILTRITAGSQNTMLMMGASSVPAWSTPTYPTSASTSGKVMMSDGTNFITSTPTYPNAATAIGQPIRGDGTNFVAEWGNGSGALTGATGSIANSETKIFSSDAAMAANRLLAGTTVTIKLKGTASGGASPGAPIFRVRYGTAATTSDGQILSFTLGTAPTSGTTIAFSAEITFTVRTVGGSATVDGTLTLVNQGVTGISTTATQVIRGSASTFNTATASTFFTVSFISGSTNESAIIQDAVMKFDYK